MKGSRRSPELKATRVEYVCEGPGSHQQWANADAPPSKCALFYCSAPLKQVRKSKATHAIEVVGVTR